MHTRNWLAVAVVFIGALSLALAFQAPPTNEVRALDGVDLLRGPH